MRKLTDEFVALRQWFWREGALALVAGVVLGLAAWRLGDLSAKWLLALFGGIIVIMLIAVIPHRNDFLSFVMIAALPFSMFKSFTDVDRSYPGAPALFMTTTEVLLLILLALRARDGQLGDDLRRNLFSTPSLLVWGMIITTLPSFLTITDYDHGIWEVARMLRMYILYSYILFYVQGRHQITIVIMAIALILIGESSVALYQGIAKKPVGLSFLGEPTSVWNVPVQGVAVLRATGTFVEPNSFGEVMGVLLALTLSLLIVVREWRYRLPLIGLFILGIAALAYSLSRTGIAVCVLAVGLTILLHLWHRRLPFRLLMGLVLIAILVVAIVWGAVGSSLITKFKQYLLELSVRSELNDLAWQMVWSSPLTGIGLNNFQTVEDSFFFRGTGIGLRYYTVHNVYLVVLSESGLIGISGFLAFLGGVMLIGWRAVKSPERLYNGIATGLFSGFCGLFIGEFFAFATKEDRSATIFWMLWGFLVAVSRLAAQVEHNTDLPATPPISASESA